MSRPRGLGLVGILLAASLWFILVPPGGVFVASIGEVLEAFADLAGSGTLFLDTADSLKRVVSGVLIAFCVAVGLGTASYFFPLVGHIVSGPIEVVRPVPPIAWVPIAIVVFGIGDAPAVAIVGLGAFFPIWLAVFRGVLEVREQHLLAARSLGASPLQTFSRVVVPSVTPHVFHGLRLGVGLGWFCVVAAEMMGAQTGLGYGVQLYSLNLQIPRTYCYILTIGIMGFVLNVLIVSLQARYCRWHSREIAN